MKTIDLAAADKAMAEMMAEFGLSDKTYSIHLELWTHNPEEAKEIKFGLTAFTDACSCEHARGADWKDAIESLRVKVRASIGAKVGVDNGEPLEVIVPEIEEPAPSVIASDSDIPF